MNTADIVRNGAEAVKATTLQPVTGLTFLPGEKGSFIFFPLTGGVNFDRRTNRIRSRVRGAHSESAKVEPLFF